MNTPPFDFVERDFPLAPATLYRVGGPASFALFPSTPEEAAEAYAWILKQDAPHLVLGGGSNVLIHDRGFRGYVLFTTALKRMDDLGNDRYEVGAGVVLDDMVQQLMLAKNYAMVGGLTGIPGSVGGAIYMNAGTVNGSTCQLMENVSVLKADGVHTIPMEESLFDYRGQSFCAPGEVILGGVFAFTRTDEPQQPIYDHYKKRRLEKQPQGNCCGSVFKNPEGDHAGRLIEACGLKGTRRGGAIISPMHANFIMNEDGASYDDVRGLMLLAKETVAERFGVTLEEEVRLIVQE
jgi:UDP-N-acetylmuramate dehydrogenase